MIGTTRGILFAVMVPVCCISVAVADQPDDTKTQNSSVESTEKETREDQSEQHEKGSRENFFAKEVVVTASRTDIAAMDAPQSVSVIRADEIMASPFERVEDLVRSVPGVYNYRHYGQQTSGIQSPLSMRGVGKNRVLLLVDGVPQNDSFNNSISWVAWGHIPRESIERIEIVRGPSSALYGSEGLGGVINIITKNPSAQRETTVRGEAGTADTYAVHGIYSQSFGDLGLMVSGGYDESDGFYMVEDPADYETRRHRQAFKVLAKVSYALSPISDLSFSALSYRHETGKGREYFYDELELNQYWLSYRRRGDRVDFQSLAYLNLADKTAYQDSAADDFSSLLRKEKMTPLTAGVDAQGSTAFGAHTRATFGLSGKYISWEYEDNYTASSRDVGAEGRQEFFAPFANVDIGLLDERLLLYAGARYDWIKNSDGANRDSQASAGKPPYSNRYEDSTWSSFSPKIGFAWHLADNRTTFRASVGKGFRAPSLFELYKVHVRQGGRFYREANPDLEPESIWSYDLGADRFLSDALWARISLYRSRAEQYIGDRLVGTSQFSGGRTRFDYVLDNISEVDIQGVEAEAQWYASNGSTLFVNYTYNRSEVASDENNPELVGNALPNEPRHQAHAGVRWLASDWVNLTLIGNYYGDIYYDSENTLRESGYATMDASLSLRFSRLLKAYVNVENMFDEAYPISLSLSASDIIAPGRVVNVGLAFDF